MPLYTTSPMSKKRPADEIKTVSKKHKSTFHEELWEGDKQLAGLPDTIDLLQNEYTNRPTLAYLGL